MTLDCLTSPLWLPAPRRESAAILAFLTPSERKASDHETPVLTLCVVEGKKVFPGRHYRHFTIWEIASTFDQVRRTPQKAISFQDNIFLGK